MQKEPLAKLVWQGDDTIAAVRKLLTTAQRIEITLPANYNHALFTALHPDAASAAAETIDSQAGPELLQQIAQVRGLEPMSTLADILRPLGARVHLLSPPLLVIDNSGPQ